MITKQKISALAIAAFATSSFGAHALCAGGVVHDVTTVYMCSGGGCGAPFVSFPLMYYKTNCVLVCCPDGTVTFNEVTCDDMPWTLDIPPFSIQPKCCGPHDPHLFAKTRACTASSGN
jgi:hypothetical protein